MTPARKSERETIISWTEDESTASVYSTERRWWRRVERVGGVLLRDGRDSKDKEIWREYAVDRRCVRLARLREAKKPRSEAQKAALRRGNRAGSPRLAPDAGNELSSPDLTVIDGGREVPRA